MRPGLATVEDMRRAARRRLPRLVFDYIDGAAGDERAKEGNAAALGRIALQPRVLVNVDGRSAATRFLGRDYAQPFGISPMGMCNLAGPGTDRALAGCAAAADIPIAVSSMASTTLEEMHRHAEGRAWFQLYVGGPVEQALGLVERARKAGYDTLVLTADVPQVGRRPRDVRNGFLVPFRIGPRQALDFALHPRWSLATLAAGAPKPANYDGGFDRNASRAAADWAFLDRLRDLWKGRLIVKGVMSAADAVRVRDAGADAVWVSNHGARQLDSASPAVEALTRVRAAVGPDCPLVLDSGVRSGEDVVRALASGADLVMLGRPWLYAAAAAGAAGPAGLARLLGEEVSLTMAQIGVTRTGQIGPGVLAETADRAGQATRAGGGPARPAPSLTGAGGGG